MIPPGRGLPGHGPGAKGQVFQILGADGRSCTLLSCGFIEERKKMAHAWPRRGLCPETRSLQLSETGSLGEEARDRASGTRGSCSTALAGTSRGLGREGGGWECSRPPGPGQSPGQSPGPGGWLSLKQTNKQTTLAAAFQATRVAFPEAAPAQPDARSSNPRFRPLSASAGALARLRAADMHGDVSFCVCCSAVAVRPPPAL